MILTTTLLATTYLVYRQLRHIIKVAKRDIDNYGFNLKAFRLSPGIYVREWDISYIIKKETI